MKIPIRRGRGFEESDRAAGASFQVTGDLGLHGALDRFSGTVVNLDARLALTGAVPLGSSTHLEVGATGAARP
jgi:hypothetical protein